MKAVSFKNRNVDVAANLYFPEGFDASRQYPTIICAHPISSCKEQTSGAIYAARLAKMGYVTLAFDASFQEKVVASHVFWKTRRPGGGLPLCGGLSGDPGFCG